MEKNPDAAPVMATALSRGALKSKERFAMHFNRLTMYIFCVLVFLVSCSQSQAADFSAPLIVLPLDKGTEDGVPFKVTARITDESGLESVMLYYRPAGSMEDFKALPMIPERAGDLYSVTLSSGLLSGAGIEYYIEARDRASNISQEPFPDKPRKIRLASKEGRPETLAIESGSRDSNTKKWIWVGLGVLVTGALLSAAADGGDDGKSESTTLVIEAPVPGTE